MGRVDRELKEAKIEYEKAKRIGNRALEAQWANSIADTLKNRGECVEALRWLRIDYESSMKFLPQKLLLPTCQSLGKMYLRLEQFENALKYQDTIIPYLEFQWLIYFPSFHPWKELSLTGIRLNKAMVDGICKFASSYTLSGLLLGGTYIGLDGALSLTAALGSGPQELVKLDLSYCGLSSHDFPEKCANISLICGLLELNLGGTSIGQEEMNLWKSFVLDKNARMAQDKTLEYEAASPRCSGNKMEVPDSDDEEATKEEPAGLNDSFASSSCRKHFAGSQLVQDLCAAIESAVNLQLFDLSRNGLFSEVIEVLYGLGLS